jgi:hypothetical protein
MFWKNTLVKTQVTSVVTHKKSAKTHTTDDTRESARDNTLKHACVAPFGSATTTTTTPSFSTLLFLRPRRFLHFVVLLLLLIVVVISFSDAFTGSTSFWKNTSRKKKMNSGFF